MGKRKRWMKTFSSVMQSIVGCITLRTTNGAPFMRSWANARLTQVSHNSPNLAGQDGLLKNRLRSYEVCLSDESIYILAASAEDAAWEALELSNNKPSKLLDVRLIDE